MASQSTAPASQQAVERSREVYRDRGRRVVMPLDPGAPPLEMNWPELKRLLADRARIARDGDDIRRAISKLEAGVREAAKQDTQELAEKLRAGGRAQPPADMDAHERAAKEALSSAQRRLNALTAAAAMVEDELATLVGAQSPRWARECRERERKAAKKLSDAAEELQAAHAELSAARRFGGWCSDPSIQIKPGFTPPDHIELGYDQLNGEPAVVGVSEFVGLLLSQELRDGSALP